MSINITGSILVNGVEHSLRCVSEGPASFVIEAQNLKTGDQWRADFSKSYVENITKKTGSFKEYSVFLDMMSDAINDCTDHVYVELLTYSDLVALKTGRHSRDKKSPDNKRYLILTYKVKYDTVHYPLPLVYTGKVSQIELEDNVCKLQVEIEQLKNQIISVGSPRRQDQHLPCCKENAILKQEIEKLQSRNDGKKENNKMIKNLQESLRNLESDLIREKNKYQRSLDKKNRECKQLIEEVENFRSENRALTVKLRSVTTDLNIAKRNKLNSYQRARSITPNNRSSQLSGGSVERGNRRGSVDRGNGSVDRGKNRSVERSRGSSIERSGYSRNSGYSSRSNSRSSAKSAPEVRTRARTPSPAGARFPRFDPSAYVKDKQRRTRESQSKRDRHTKTNTYLPRARSTPLERASPSHSLYHKPPPSSVVRDIIKNNILSGKRRSGSCSSLDSCRSNDSRGSQQGRNGNKKQRANSRNSKSSNSRKPKRFAYPSSGSEGEDKENPRTYKKTVYLNSPVSREHNISQLSFTKDSEIAEIDARLNALQTYLKDAQNKQYPY